jgi:4-methyl-5(b-hydroxyethyl)-thiazole monophosphate biosynthesis
MQTKIAKENKIVYFIGDGFRPEEYFYSKDVIENAGIEVKVAGARKGVIPAADISGQPDSVESDLSFNDVNLNDYSGIVVPGGTPGWGNLLKNDMVIQLIKEANERGMLVASMCGSPAVLSKAGVLINKKATIYPGMGSYLVKGGALPKNVEESYEEKIVVVNDGNIITANGVWASKAFGKAIVEYLNKLQSFR